MEIGQPVKVFEGGKVLKGHIVGQPENAHDPFYEVELEHGVRGFFPLDRIEEVGE